ncbi:hypothetical protein YC2023_025566 [Brassica napus]
MSSLFKSFAGNPREAAAMAMVQSSSYRVLSGGSCSNLRRNTPLDSFLAKGRSPVKAFSFMFSTQPNNEFGHSSKRRSRGPVMAAKKASEGEKQEDGKYKHTVDLPKTGFGMRANALTREPELQKLWDENQVFKRVSDSNYGVSFSKFYHGNFVSELVSEIGSFVLHDGPPYANGDLHMGHALNKILKDIINRYKVFDLSLLGDFSLHPIMEFLPIKLSASSSSCSKTIKFSMFLGGIAMAFQLILQSLDQEVRKELTPLKLRAKAAKFAKATVKTQMESFKRFGVWADWNNPYLTLDPEYEAAQIEVFGQMALLGYIYRGRKPVHWSPSSRTALAEAELELQYSVVEVQSSSEDESASTSNKKKMMGKVLKNQQKLFVIVATDLVPALEAKWGVKLIITKTFLGSDLEGFRYTHPVDKRDCPVVIGGDYITTESGTGLVHTAPGHGQEDYATGLKYGLPIVSPVDDGGNFTEEAGQFRGLSVLGEGNSAVVSYLDENMSLVMEESYAHKYPYDWRTKKPTIFRATEQWFASVEGFRKATMEAINNVKWIPHQAVNRITAMTSSRSDWCISRQRTWGVPIPVFYHVQTKEPLMNEETVDHVKSIISQKGSDAWWYMSVEDLLPEKYRDKAADYEKGTDTMDVWFDSGSSWAGVLGKREGLTFPADVYLEGTDQHRGWFQSSLLTSIATKGKAPYSSVITHGFVLDEKGMKMSKSLGNVVDPLMVIEGGKNSKDAPAYGADVMRLWVSSVDYTGDVLVGPQILRQMSDIYRKLRGTLRYLLGNIHDWRVDNAVPYQDLPIIDQHALFQLENVVKNIKECYENYQFFKIFQIIQRFTIVDLSNFYFDIAKDRLYTGGTSSFTRRSCQTVLSTHLLSILRVIAPIVPHLAEDVWQNLPFEYRNEDGCQAKFVFELKWPTLNEQWLSFPAEDILFWERLLELRTEVNKVLELARNGKLIGSSLEAKVYLHTPDAGMASKLLKMCEAQNEADTLQRIFITSQVEVLSSVEKEMVSNVQHTGEYGEGENKVWIGVSRAEGSKCERCWNYSGQVGSFSDHPTLCGRCFNVIIANPPQPAVATVIS